jgi:hypothetical protein
MASDSNFVVPGESCGNCRYWLRRTDFGGDMGGGYCRRFPPSFQMDETLNDAWPNVHQQQWCGEWSGRR